MSAFTGTGRLTRLALRRDRLQLPLWIIVTTFFASGSYSASKTQYATEADRLFVLRTAAKTPALLMLRSAPTGSSVAELAMFQLLPFVAITAGFMSTLAVVRHTRQNEETGRTEMIGATVVGRYASLTAALLVAVGANALVVVLSALAFIGNGAPAPGSAAAGLAIGLTGIAFAAIAAVAAQITQGARAANGIAAAAIGIAYVLRAVGDAFGDVHANGYTITAAWPSWLSPIGWAALVHPYAGNRWWVLVLPLALSVAGIALAFALTNRRDVGMGMIADRPGPARAASGLLSPIGLAWRLQRGTLTGWAVAMLLSGLGVGSISGALDTLGDGSGGAADTIRKLGGDVGSVTDSFWAAMLGLFGALVACYVVQALQRLRAEESGGRAEPTLATATARLRWLGSHLFVAVVGALGLLLLAGVSAALLVGLHRHDLGGELADLTGGALVQLAPSLVIAGFAVAVFGLVPRLAVGLAWAGLAVSIACGPLGDLLSLPDPVRNISPFTHIPAVPVAHVTATPLVVLVLVAAVLGAAGMASFRRRDLTL